MSQRHLVLALALPLFAASLAVRAQEEPPAEEPDPDARCTLPGEQVVEDDPADSSTGLPGHEIEGIYVAEPSDLELKTAVTLKIAQDQSLANTTYRVGFKLDDGMAYFVLRSGNAYTYGHVDESGMDVSDGDAEEGSTTSSDGFITWVLSHEKIAPLHDATEMSEITGDARFLGSSRDTTDAGTYALRGNASCPAAKGVPSGDGLLMGGGAVSIWALLLLGAAGLGRGRVKTPVRMRSWAQRARGRALGRRVSGERPLGIREKASLRGHRSAQRLRSKDLYRSLQVVRQHMQTDLCPDPWQGLRQEVR